MSRRACGQVLRIRGVEEGKLEEGQEEEEGMWRNTTMRRTRIRGMGGRRKKEGRTKKEGVEEDEEVA